MILSFIYSLIIRALTSNDDGSDIIKRKGIFAFGPLPSSKPSTKLYWMTWGWEMRYLDFFKFLMGACFECYRPLAR
jgi:hypothetical protein